MSRFPTQISPMLAVPGEIFDAPDYTFEVKWDGIRALAYKDSDRFSLKTRNLKEALSPLSRTRKAFPMTYTESK